MSLFAATLGGVRRLWSDFYVLLDIDPPRIDPDLKQWGHLRGTLLCPFLTMCVHSTSR